MRGSARVSGARTTVQMCRAAGFQGARPRSTCSAHASTTASWPSVARCCGEEGAAPLLRPRNRRPSPPRRPPAMLRQVAASHADGEGTRNAPGSSLSALPSCPTGLRSWAGGAAPHPCPRRRRARSANAAQHRRKERTCEPVAPLRTARATSPGSPPDRPQRRRRRRVPTAGMPQLSQICSAPPATRPSCGCSSGPGVPTLPGRRARRPSSVRRCTRFCAGPADRWTRPCARRWRAGSGPTSAMYASTRTAPPARPPPRWAPARTPRAVTSCSVTAAPTDTPWPTS